MFLPYEIVFEGDDVNSSYSYRYYYDQFRQVVAYMKFDGANNKLLEYGSTSCDSLEKRIALADKYSGINPNCSIFYIIYGEKDEYYRSKTYYSRISSPEFTSSDILTVYVNIDFRYSSLEAMSKYTAYPERGEYYSYYRNKDGFHDELYHFNWTYYEMQDTHKLFAHRSCWNTKNSFNVFTENIYYSNLGNIVETDRYYKEDSLPETFKYEDSNKNTWIYWEYRDKKFKNLRDCLYSSSSSFDVLNYFDSMDIKDYKGNVISSWKIENNGNLYIKK